MRGWDGRGTTRIAQERKKRAEEVVKELLPIMFRRGEDRERMREGCSRCSREEGVQR